MPAFKLLFRVEPPSYFGLPEGDKLVIKAELGREILGSVFDNKSGNLVGHGTLSEFRRYEDAVKLEISLGDSELQVNDNFFSLSIDADSEQAAVTRGVSVFEKFLRLLMVQHGDLFTFDLVQIQGPDGHVTSKPGPRIIELVRATVYHLGELRERLTRAGALSSLTDERLNKALVYYEHARFLFNMKGHASLFSVHYSFVLTSAYLYLWKALTVILGDPSSDSDYQRRYLTFGLPKGFWQDEMVPLKEVRDAYDVAHYTLDEAAIQTVQHSFGRAELLARRVILAYAEHLSSIG